MKRPSNGAFLLAAIFTIIFLLAHVFIGGQRYHAYFLEQPIAPEQKALFSVLWHAFSLHLAACAGALFLAAYRPALQNLAIFILITFTAYFVFDLAVGVMAFAAPWPLVQWVFLLPIIVAIAFGLKKKLST